MSELYQEKVETEGRILCFRVYKSHGETPRLQVRQARPLGWIGPPLHEQVNICEEDVAEFISGVLRAAAAMGKEPPRAKRQTEEERYAEVRKRYPNAYRPWSAEEDRRLLAAVADKVAIEQIAIAHGRGIGSIQSRIAKHFPEEARA
ncbi:MAG TPA: hypothetical protein PKA27_12275 [Fimbriimonadaceae bacterium]|nr:hypothetical protein [Fimbriimonadaceae bacterium]